MVSDINRLPKSFRKKFVVGRKTPNDSMVMGTIKNLDSSAEYFRHLAVQPVQLHVSPQHLLLQLPFVRVPTCQAMLHPESDTSHFSMAQG